MARRAGGRSEIPWELRSDRGYFVEQQVTNVEHYDRIHIYVHLHSSGYMSNSDDGAWSHWVVAFA